MIVSIILLFSYKTTEMQKYISTVIFSILLFAVIILSAINYHDNDVLESRINTIYKNTKEIKSEKSFKEDYYILQQSRDTDLLLLVFGILVAVTGFFTYKSVVDRFDYKTVELTKENEAYKKLLIEELGELKMDFFSHGADLDNERAQTFLKNGNFQHYILYAMSCVQKNYEYYSHLMKAKPNEDHEYIIKVIVETLQEINNNLEPSIKISDSSNSVIEDSLKKIRRIDNTEVHRHLSAIQSKFKIIPDAEYYKL